MHRNGPQRRGNTPLHLQGLDDAGIPIIGKDKVVPIPPAFFEATDEATGNPVKMAVQQVVVVSISSDLIDLIATAVVGKLEANIKKENLEKFSSIHLA
jgi:hypothetical protein